MVEIFVAASGLVFICLALTGAGLALAAIVALVDRPVAAAGVDAARVRAGRWRAVRRLAAAWVVAAAVWFAATQVLRLAMGP